MEKDLSTDIIKHVTSMLKQRRDNRHLGAKTGGIGIVTHLLYIWNYETIAMPCKSKLAMSCIQNLGFNSAKNSHLNLDTQTSLQDSFWHMTLGYQDSGAEVAWANKRYHGHHTLPPIMLAEVWWAQIDMPTLVMFQPSLAWKPGLWPGLSQLWLWKSSSQAASHSFSLALAWPGLSRGL